MIVLISSFGLFFGTIESYAELRNGMDADVVIGQPDFASSTSNNGGRSAKTLSGSYNTFSDGERLHIADAFNHRVLIFNAIPTSNHAPADLVLGQQDFTSGGVAVAANRFNSPQDIFSDGQHLFVADQANNRAIIFNAVPTANFASANVAIGQPDLDTSGANTGGLSASSISDVFGVCAANGKLFIADRGNNRVLIFNKIPTSHKAPADVVIGQPDFTSNGINAGLATCRANTLFVPFKAVSDGKKLIICDTGNNRVLIFNKVPTTNNVSADVVIGQKDFISNSANQGGSVGPNTLWSPSSIYYDGKRLFIADRANVRVLVYNNLPSGNNALADVVLGQPDFYSNGTNVSATGMVGPRGVFSDGKRLFVSDISSHRVLIYNIGSSSLKPGPQFEQGKAVVGKVFHDVNGNGTQDQEKPATSNQIPEKGIEGVKVVSDTGIYAITDSDGKYHFPYIETGQHLLKVDPATLPEGSTITTDNPYKVTVTKGVLTKVSFGVKLPYVGQLVSSPVSRLERDNRQTGKPDDDGGPLLKVSVSQDPVMLKPRLAVSHKIITNDALRHAQGLSRAKPRDEAVELTIDCNYHLYIVKSRLTLYDEQYKKLKEIDLPNPPPMHYKIPIKDLPPNTKKLYYQLAVYDRNNDEDRTGVGSIRIE